MAEKALQRVELVMLADGRVTPTETGLIFNRTLHYEEWEALGRQLRRIEGAVMWWLGDWLNYGERAYGEAYAQAVNPTAHEYSTRANAAWVASRIEPSRRRENLSWSHHLEVAALEPVEQDSILAKAEEEDWTRARTRRAVRAFKRQLEAGDSRGLPSSGQGYEIREGDFREVLADVRGVACIVTDPPYAKEALELYRPLAELGYRTLRRGGHLIAMVGHAHLPEALAELCAGGLTYLWPFACLLPGSNRQIFSRRVMCAWKPIVVLAKEPEYGEGDWKCDVISSPVREKDMHEWQQSEAAMSHLIEAFSDPDDTVLDPMCGSGTTGAAALKLGRRFIGVDIDALAVATTKKRLAEIVNEPQTRRAQEDGR